MRGRSLNSLKQTLQLLPGQAVQNGSFFKARAARLIDSAADQRQFARAVRIGIDGDHDAGLCCSSRVLGREVQPVRTRVDLEKAAILPRLLDHPFDVDFVARTLEQQASGRMSRGC